MNRVPRAAWTSVSLLTIGFIFLLLIVGVTVRLANQAQANLNSAVAARNISRLAVQLQSGLHAAESSQRGYIASNNEIYLAPFSTAKIDANAALDRLISLLDDEPSAENALVRLKSIVVDKFSEMDETIALKRNGQTNASLAIFQSNRGKALMDEANVFISSILRKADAKLTDGLTRQTNGLSELQKITLFFAGMMVVIVSTAVGIILNSGFSLARSRDKIRAMNSELERRVEERTSELEIARNRAELLLVEVNHRVANSLAMVASMVGLQSRNAKHAETRNALSETQTRIGAVALVHKKLYTSGDVHTVALDEFLASLMQQLEVSMQSAGHSANLNSQFEPLSMPTDKTICLGVIATEWVTNAFKYAYPDTHGEIRITLKHVENGLVELSVEDDGIGLDLKDRPQGTGLGTKLVTAMASTLRGRIEYPAGRIGTVARITLPAT